MHRCALQTSPGDDGKQGKEGGALELRNVSDQVDLNVVRLEIEFPSIAVVRQDRFPTPTSAH